MRIRNKTNMCISVAGRDKIYPEVTYLYAESKFDSILVECEYGSAIIVREQDELHIYTSGNLVAIYRFDMEMNDFLVDILYSDKFNGCIKDNWFEQQDKTLHDKTIRDASNHLPNAHITAFKRIDELTDAIKKSVQICVPNETTSDVKLIRNWAKEIMFQCNIIDSINED